ncbi:MAG: peptidase dipeptidylpeptidase domain protein [Gemmatimonadetes bacterium]|nr:peptidase dipeptidylpeptidase domain protein [Gemmatimonadota bacterium]
MRLARLSALLLAAGTLPLRAQATDPSRITVERIFASPDFRGGAIPQPAWLRSGSSYIDARPAKDGGTELVKVDIATGKEEVLVRAEQLSAEGRRLDVEELSLSGDERQALLFHNSVQVWRANTRGRFDVFDFRTGKLTPVSANAGLQMFAKVSPDGRKVAFVRDNDLYVTDLATRREQRLTRDGSENIINGTTDWVYEEELGLRDAFRWSPDSRRIAYWRFDQSAVPAFPIVNELGLYPKVATLRYPKAGQPNSRVKVGVITLANGTTTWLTGAGPDTGQYIARMEWVDADSLAVQRIPRRQTSVDILMLSASTGRGRTVMTDRDSAYVDVENGDLRWIDAKASITGQPDAKASITGQPDARASITGQPGAGKQQFLWLSDRSGWRQLFLYGRDGRVVRQLTTDGADVLGVEGVDEQNGYVYVTVAAPTPMERNLYRVSLAGGAMTRVTPQAGTHAVSISPDARYLMDIHSTINSPAVATLYALPSMHVIRVLQDNAALKARLSQLAIRPATFLKVPMPDGTQLDAYRIVPASFDSTRKYPVLMHVYGGPASPKVNDAWMGADELWHQSMAQQGYVVIVVDNRGSAWRGRDFRKTTQLRLGLKESQDQIDAATWIGRQSWGDAGRIGIWGWSFGGSMTFLSAARGGPVFKAAIVVAPVTDWGLYDTIYTERFMWTPQENPVGYRESSPQRFAGGLTARTLLVHGTGDDNVHPQNTIQLANTLEAANKPFYMLLYPGRTHSISGGNTRVHLYNSFTRFLLENL